MRESKSSFGRVEGVLVETRAEARPAESGEAGKLEVIRDGRERQAHPDMSLRKGDALVTGPDGVGVMTLAEGYQVIMDPSTELTIENPSVFVRVGRIIVKKLKEIRQAFTVRTELGSAAVEGTEFVLEIDRQRQVQITMLEGQVKVYPAEGLAWHDTLTYVAGNRGQFNSDRFEWLAALSASEMDSVRRRIKDVEIAAKLSPADGDRSEDADRNEATAPDPWTMTAGQYHGKNGQRFSFHCPPGGIQHRVWGTEVYTDDSSICTAAVHTGAITFDKGGFISIEILPGQDAYEGTTSHGVTTGGWGSWSGSFRVIHP
jgi:hypothetical protein